MKPILPGAPWLIAHKSMLGVNQPQKITLNGHDYVLWQNSQGEVFALDNICPHMQAPLSEGWICADKNTIICPFHALEFDGQGHLYRQGKSENLSLASPLTLTVIGDWIWTYGLDEPKVKIPDILKRLTQDFEFLGVSGERNIQADFLSCLKINYDFNHLTGTHRDIFNFSRIEVREYQTNGYCTQVNQQVTMEKHSPREILRNPALAIAPTRYTNVFEYAFPSIAGLIAHLPSMKIAQFFILYPELECQTKTFALVYVKVKNKLLFPIIKKNLLAAFTTVVEQDTTTLESLYPSQKPKIRLPNEEIMFHAEKLYR